jgi:hypothetical protein
MPINSATAIAVIPTTVSIFPPDFYVVLVKGFAKVQQ